MSQPPATPGSETAEVPLEPGPRSPALGWKARVLRGLRRHEEEREEEPGARPPQAPSLGRYRLLRELGRGGMGAVHEAEDTLLGRRVALKLLHADRATPQLIERFGIEARAAARLRHPNIVALHEVGEEAGQRFLVMELVAGRSLAARLQQEGPLPSREAARIAERVADALAYAHSRAILHRDVKPANVLLDAEERPLLSDFGLAKEVERAGAGPTDTGQAMGTPAYMAPEQVRGELERVDRRADVYALGVTLFEMLTGRVPFEAPSVPALLQAILQRDPPAPGRLRAGVDRDLETICLRCLEKEPEARYASAGELAEDLRRFLRDEPIAARRPGPLERVGKWLRRNRGVARTLAGTSAVALVVIVSGTAAFLLRLSRERDRAEGSALRAETSARDARQALKLLVREVEAELGDVPGERVRGARERLLRQALERLLALQEREAPGRPSLEAVEAWGQLRELELEAGHTARAGEAAEQALALARRLLTERATAVLHLRAAMSALHGVAQVAGFRGDHQAALAPCREALELGRRIAAELPGEVQAQEELAVCLYELGSAEHAVGELARARGHLEESLRLRRGLAAAGQAATDDPGLANSLQLLGNLLLDMGLGAEAQPVLEEGVATLREQLARQPDSAGGQRNLAAALAELGKALARRGDPAGARAAQEEALALRRRLLGLDPGSLHFRRALAMSLVDVGNLAEGRGEAAAALPLFQEAAALLRELLALDPADRNSESHLGIVLLRQADALRQQSDLPGARRALEEAIVLLRRTLEHSGPVVNQAARGLSGALFDLAAILRGSQEAAAARPLTEEGLAVLRGWVAAAPTDATAQQQLARCLNETGMTLEALEAPPEAREPLYREALELMRRRLAEHPDELAALRFLAHALILLGELPQDPEAARERFLEAEQAQRRAVQLDPDSREDRRNLVISLQRLGNMDKEGPEPARALPRYEEMVAICRELLARSPSPAARRDLRFALQSLGDGRRRAGDEAGASQAYREAVALEEPGQANLPSRDLFKALASAGQAALEASDVETAGAKYGEALEIARLRLAALPQDALARRDLAVVLLRLSDVHRNTGRSEEAVRVLEEAVEVHRSLAEQLPDRYGDERTTFLRVLSEARRDLALVRGEVAPATPEEALGLAGILVDRGEHARAVPCFAKALEVEALRADLESRNLYRAASAASRAAAAEKDPAARGPLLERGLAWLGEDLRRRRELLARAEAEPPGPAREKQLAELRGGLEKRLRLARADDADLAALRAAPGFAALVE